MRSRSLLDRSALVAFALLLVVRAVPSPASEPEDDGFKPIFNGKDLAGWDGNPKFWRVEEGAIVGQTTDDNPTDGNTFLVWKDGELDDFELKLEYKIEGGNSGIQYRSFRIPGAADAWRIGGYQADIDSGDTYSGIIYGEAARGVLTGRGEKTELKKGGEKSAERFGDSAEIQSKISKDGWNSYHIVAKGNHLTQYINGVKTAELIDNDEPGQGRRMDQGLLALQLHAGPSMKIQFKDVVLKRTPLEGKKKVAFFAGPQSHGYGAHEHKAGCMLLAKALNESDAGILATVYTGGWPNDPTALDNVHAVVIYCDGADGHMAIPHLKELDAKVQQGVGLTCIHFAVEVPKGNVGDRFLNWLGGYFELLWSVNPHWTADFSKLPDHPIARGVQPFEINDEWYYHMRFRPEMKNVSPILTAVPPDATRGRDGDPPSSRGGNEAVRARKGMAEHVCWASEPAAGGRGVGFTGGHVHWNWGHPQFRKLVLNAIVWTTGADVPEGGIDSKPLTVDDLMANQDEEVPADFNRAAMEEMVRGWNAG